MNELYRVSGACLEVDVVWIDVEVINITLEGIATIRDTSSDKTWTITLDEFKEWMNQDKAASHTAISDISHPVWDSLNNTYTQFGDDPDIEDSDSLQEKVHFLFKAVVSEHTDG